MLVVPIAAPYPDCGVDVYSGENHFGCRRLTMIGMSLSNESRAEQALGYFVKLPGESLSAVLAGEGRANYNSSLRLIGNVLNSMDGMNKPRNG
jgi:hypothetical protein